MRVLIIEENINLLESLKRFLSKNNIIPEITHDALYGMGLILTNNYDLVILDLNLHHISTSEILKTAYTHDVKTPFIAITKKMGLSTKLLNNELVANEYLPLPFSNESLIFKINETIKLNKNCYFLKDDILIEEFALKYHNKKQYLTTTEILILINILNENNSSEELINLCFSLENMWIYIDSLNKKMAKLSLNSKIIYRNNHYIMEGFKNGE